MRVSAIGQQIIYMALRAQIPGNNDVTLRENFNQCCGPTPTSHDSEVLQGLQCLKI